MDKLKIQLEILSEQFKASAKDKAALGSYQEAADYNTKAGTINHVLWIIHQQCKNEK